MKPSKGYYCLIQYCPDLGRLEAANIGVLLFSAERHFLKALVSSDNRRIIHFFGSEGHDWARVNSFKNGLVDRIAIEAPEIHTVEQLMGFIAQRANLLQITAPRPMKVLDPEKDLAGLFAELVGGTVRRGSNTSFLQYLAGKFAEPGLERKIRRDIRVTVPILEKQIDIPFGFQNGRFNLITPVRFEAKNPEQCLITACKYAVEGHSLYENPDPQFGDLQLVVVGRFRPKDRDSAAKVERVFEGYDVKLYRAQDLSQLVNEIKTTGKDIEATADRA